MSPSGEYHDPLPPGTHCLEAWHEEFEHWLTTYTELCKAGYWCRPSTHMFVAWLAGRGARSVSEVAHTDDIISSSEDAQRVMREFSLTEAPCPAQPMTQTRRP